MQGESRARLYAKRGLPPHLANVEWRTSAPISRVGEQIGFATSGCWSPLLKRSLALAHIQAPHFDPGTPVEIEVSVEHHSEQADAIVRTLPFYDPERKRA